MNMRITRKRSNGERQAPHLQTPFYNRIYLLTSIVALLALIFFIIPGRQVTRTTGGRVFKKRINDGRQRNCSDFCNAHRSKRKERFSGDLLNRTHLVRLVTKARNELISDKLLVDYGDHFEIYLLIGALQQLQVQASMGMKLVTGGSNQRHWAQVNP